MNTKLALTAIALFAVMLGMSALAPAMAVKPDPKIWVCHFAEAEEVLGDDGLPTGEIIPAHYVVILISENGWNGHQNHFDGNEDVDFRDEINNDEVVVRAVCDDRNAALPAP